MNAPGRARQKMAQERTRQTFDPDPYRTDVADEPALAWACRWTTGDLSGRQRARLTLLQEQGSAHIATPLGFESEAGIGRLLMEAPSGAPLNQLLTRLGESALPLRFPDLARLQILALADVPIHLAHDPPDY